MALNHFKQLHFRAKHFWLRDLAAYIALRGRRLRDQIHAFTQDLSFSFLVSSNPLTHFADKGYVFAVSESMLSSSFAENESIQVMLGSQYIQAVSIADDVFATTGDESFAVTIRRIE